jgi:hypothetical protein
MPVAGALITVAGSAYAANRQRSAADRAARASADAANQGREDIRGYYDLFSQNASPYMSAGTNALGRQMAFLGGDYGDALKSPDYTARFDMGLKAADRSAAARGGLFSGGHSADLLDYGGQMASQGLNAYWDRLAGISNMGANMTSNLGAAGLSAASGMAAQGNMAGNARASGYMAAGDAQSQFGGALAGAANRLGQSRGWWG